MPKEGGPPTSDMRAMMAFTRLTSASGHPLLTQSYLCAIDAMNRIKKIQNRS